eukprot:2697261-Prymnesium_polylepis.1
MGAGAGDRAARGERGSCPNAVSLSVDVAGGHRLQAMPHPTHGGVRGARSAEMHAMRGGGGG